MVVVGKAIAIRGVQVFDLRWAEFRFRGGGIDQRSIAILRACIFLKINYDKNFRKQFIA
jgi:hypothetical protein